MTTQFSPVFPARAGINPVNLEEAEKESRVPRASGDKPVTLRADEFLNGCSPRERG